MSVLVCGSGISALSAACALKQAGLAVRVLGGAGGAGAGTSGHFAGEHITYMSMMST
jgi:glycine/D-amino acid oxidase-like deaminating enzyme